MPQGNMPWCRSADARRCVLASDRRSTDRTGLQEPLEHDQGPISVEVTGCRNGAVPFVVQTKPGSPGEKGMERQMEARARPVVEKVTSKDGTVIAYERSGAGPAVILVDGALCSRAFGPMPKLAPLLARRFTVFMYDRRGRGDSGDTAPYAIDREVEDLDALIAQAGGAAAVFGYSSGA